MKSRLGRCAVLALATATALPVVAAGSATARQAAAPRSATHASGAHALRFHPGAPGVGDPYFPREGNGGYDVGHYDLALAYVPTSHRLRGTATITATARTDLSRFDLDLSGYRVSSVTVDGQPARFRRFGQELVITPRRGLARGSRFDTVVAYAGVPRTVTDSPVVFGAPYGWIYTKDGAFVGCEPNAAHTWFPSNDHPRDKASFHVAVTVPRGTEVVANGDYQGHHVSGGSDTFSWDQPQPQATYLATVDIGRWRFYQDRTPAGIRSFTAVDPALLGQTRAQHTRRLTARVTDYWATRFGRYPFRSTGAIVDDVPDIGFSLETQTRPLYGFAPDPLTLSHELSHQWFGDSVSVRSWRHIWLNEGFATFSMFLWGEHTGQGSTLRQFRKVFRQIPATDDFWHQSIADPKRNSMFSGAVYYRGGMTLAALRHRIGDHDFFRLLRVWVRTHRYSTATTAEFRALAEKVSGRDLDHFFRVWLWRQSKPSSL
jgi:aminopeptidase N